MRHHLRHRAIAAALRVVSYGVIGASVVVSTASAQTTTNPGSNALPALKFDRPSERDLPSPQFSSPDDTIAPIVPPATAPDTTERAPSQQLLVALKDVRFEGNTVFDDETLKQAIRDYLDRPIATEDLEAMRQAVTRYYIDRGYINSGALIPNQTLSEGVLVVEIVEGRLVDVQISGNDTLDAEYLRERVELGAGVPLNIKTLQEQLQIQAQNPLFDSLNANLQPGDRPGEARLGVNVEESRPYRMFLTVDNDISPDLSPVRGRVIGQLFNLTGAGDVFTANSAYGSGLRDWSFDYTRPVSARDTLFSIYGTLATARIKEGPLAALDIKSESSTFGLSVRHPVYRTPNQQLTLGVGFERRRSKSSLLGRPFAFSPGVEVDGESKVSVFRLTQDWVDRGRRQVFAARSTISIGVDAFGATITDGATPDGSFISWLGQLQWARRFGQYGYEVLFRLNAQFSDDPLLPLEQFSVGGMDTVRGYRTNLLVRDWGYSSSLELRIPIMKDDGGRTTLRLAPFIDAGGAWQRERATLTPRSIASVGVGLRWDPNPQIHAELYWGVALRNVNTLNEGIQDAGIHFLLTTSLFD